MNDETELKCDTRELLTKVPHIHSQMAERDFAELEVIIVERVRWPATRTSYALTYALRHQYGEKIGKIVYSFQGG